MRCWNVPNSTRSKLSKQNVAADCYLSAARGSLWSRNDSPVIEWLGNGLPAQDWDRTSSGKQWLTIKINWFVENSALSVSQLDWWEVIWQRYEVIIILTDNGLLHLTWPQCDNVCEDSSYIGSKNKIRLLINVILQQQRLTYLLHICTTFPTWTLFPSVALFCSCDRKCVYN